MHFPFLGQESSWAAAASECAAEQGKFWEYHAKLFGSQGGENNGAFNKDKLKGYAADMGLDKAKFNECMDSGRTEKLVQAE